MLPRICIVTDRKLAGDDFIGSLIRLLDYGFDFIQLREKDLASGEIYRIARELLELREYNIKLVVNDRVDIAKVVNASGVHLGVNSLPAEIVKKFFPELLVGISVHNLEELNSQKGYDYVFYGNVFETDCKPGLEGKGVCGLRDIVRVSKKPVYAIGGIKLDNIINVLEQGVYGVAIRSLAFSNNIDELLKIRKVIGDFYGEFNG